MAFARRGTQQVITQNSVAATSLSVSLPGAATAGDSLIVQVSTTEATPGASGVTDNQTGNVYALDVVGSKLNVAGAHVGIYSCPSINASGTFTVTYSGASGNFAIALSEYSGGPTTLDQTAAGGSNSTTNSETTSTTAAVSQSNELGIGAISHDNGTETYTVTAPYTKVVDNGASGSNSVTMVMADRIISAGGTQVCAATTNGSTATYDACIATYFSAAATGWPVQGTSDHPGNSPGLASAGSGRFQTNWWPYSPPVLLTTGVISATQDDNTAAFTAAETIPGSIGATQGNATASFIASEIVSGRLSAAQADNVAAITGRETVVVLLSSTQANNTASFSGTLLVSGVISASQADNVATITGRETVTLVLGSTQDSNTANISAVSGVLDSGAIQATQDDNVSTLAGAISDSGTISASQDNNVAAFSGGGPVEPVVPVTTVAQPGIAFIGTGKEDASFSGGHDIKKRRKEEQEVMAIIQTFIHSRHFDHRV